MPPTDPQIEAAHAAGMLAARTGKPMSDCPYDPQEQQLLALWFTRGYRSAPGADSTTQQAGEGEQQ